MKEPESNVTYVCPSQAPKPGKYTDYDATYFLGTNVKVAFLAPNGRIEHMWVYITGVDPKENTLKGKLNNDPVYATQYKCGQPVEVQTWEIEEVFEWNHDQNPS